MKYFSYDKPYQENRKLYLSLCNIYHPDKPTGNEDMIKEINGEWETYEKTYQKNIHHIETKPVEKDTDDVYTFGGFMEEFMFGFMETIIEDEDETNYVIFRGKKYSGSESEILEQIALKYGGLTLMEFTNSKEWQDYLNT